MTTQREKTDRIVQTLEQVVDLIRLTNQRIDTLKLLVDAQQEIINADVRSFGDSDPVVIRFLLQRGDFPTIERAVTALCGKFEG